MNKLCMTVWYEELSVRLFSWRSHEVISIKENQWNEMVKVELLNDS